MEEAITTTVWHRPQASMTADNAIKLAVSHPVVVQTTLHEIIIHFTPSSCCALHQEEHQNRQTDTEREGGLHGVIMR